MSSLLDILLITCKNQFQMIIDLREDGKAIQYLEGKESLNRTQKVLVIKEINAKLSYLEMRTLVQHLHVFLSRKIDLGFPLPKKLQLSACLSVFIKKNMQL